jgi:hypothetical protein
MAAHMRPKASNDEMLQMHKHGLDQALELEAKASFRQVGIGNSLGEPLPSWAERAAKLYESNCLPGPS